MYRTDKLHQGSRVAVIGGGPAGSFFAIYLARYSSELGIALEVDIYEPKSFAAAGPTGCNRCAGILSPSLVQNLKHLTLEIPESVIRNKIGAYCLHSPYGTIRVENPNPQTPIYSVYRGGGPLRFPLGVEASLDQFLLEQAKANGVNILNKGITEIHCQPQPAVVCEGTKIGYDLVALAGGINAPDIRMVGLEYIPPKVRCMAQDELFARKEDILEAFGDCVRICLFPKSDLVFGSLTPKGNFINISLLGRWTTPPSMGDFLASDIVRQLLPFPYERACGCRPLITVGAARNPAADGFVAIGDACVTRLYKDGIGSALLTAREAARTVLYHGITLEDFQRNYLRFCQALERDNRWGKVLFQFNEKIKDSRTFFLAQALLVTKEKERARRQPFNQIIWGLFTGSYSYGHILRLALAPRTLIKLAGAIFSEFGNTSQKVSTINPEKDIKILVLGGGFGGMYALLHLRKALKKRKNIYVTLVNRENFFLFTPFLHEVATGGIETRHIAYPIRQIKGWQNFRFIHGGVTSIELEQKKVFLGQLGLDYDYLVLALGNAPDFTSLPDSNEHVFTLKTLRDGMFLRNHIIHMFETADAESDIERKNYLMTFVVVGGGSTGVQFITEMRDFIHRFLLKNYPHVQPSQVHILLLQDKPHVLEGMDAKLGAYALDCLLRKGIDVRLNMRVECVTSRGIQLAGQGEISARTVIWATGGKANPIVASLPLSRDQVGRVVVNDYMEIPGFPGVYALGDIAHFKDNRWTRGLPPRAHIAVRQARSVAANIVAAINGHKRRPYRYIHMGEMVSLGSHTAAINIFGFRIYGVVARFIWLNSYLSLLMGWYNRLRVLTDWFLALIFGRDITMLDINKKEDE